MALFPKKTLVAPFPQGRSHRTLRMSVPQLAPMCPGLVHFLTQPSYPHLGAFSAPIILSSTPRALDVSFPLSSTLVTGIFLPISWTGKLRPRDNMYLMLGYSE